MSLSESVRLKRAALWESISGKQDPLLTWQITPDMTDEERNLVWSAAEMEGDFQRAQKRGMTRSEFFP